MPSQEPNAKMDELLRAYAKKRREQAEPVAEMHPATRKLLQEEVRRTLAAKTAPSSTRASWRFWRWPLLAMWGGMAVLLVMFAVLNAQFRSLAPAEEEVEVRSKKGALTRNSLPQAAARDAHRSDRDGRAPQDIGSAVVSTAPVGVPPAAPVAAPLPSTTDAILQGHAAAPSPAPAPAAFENANAPQAASSAVTENAFSAVPAAANAEPPPISTLGQTRKSAAAAARFSSSAAAAPAPSAEVVDGNFVQVHERARSGSSALPPSNVLSNFRMTRFGQQVRVLDADGSVYSGQVFDGISNRAGFGGGRAALNQAKAVNNALAETNWMFNVTGVNNSLKQNIIFTGNVLDMPWANSFDNAAAQNRNASQLQNRSNASQAPSTQNSRIMGRVQVGGGKPFEIEAKPPNP